MSRKEPVAGGIQAQKKELRALLKKRRQQMGSLARLQASQAICDTLLTLPELQRVRNCFTFSPTEEEVQLESWFTRVEDRCSLSFPVCLSRGMMEAYKPADRHQMVADRYGILAPNPLVSERIPPESLDAVIVPLLGFDQEGFRLGYGGGFYDRYLSRISAHCVLVGVAFDCQCYTPIPRESFDCSLPIIVTESAVFRF